MSTSAKHWLGLGGRVCVVTGAGSGIGAAIALELARKGVKVIGTATTDSGAVKIREMLAAFAGCDGRTLNVTDASAGEALVDAITKEHGGVQVLVNNSYLGLIRQSQRGFDMDYCVQLAFENQNVADAELRISMCKAEIEAVLAKYSLGLVYKQMMINGQVVASEWALAVPQQGPVVR